MNKLYAMTMVLMATLVVTACGGGFGNSWRYKMTVSVDTPEGIKTGYAVREVTMRNSLAITPQMTNSIDLKGEAVVVDLGTRGMVFALLSGYGLSADYGADISRYAFKMAGGQNYGGVVGTPAADGQAGRLDLPPTWYPLLVRFRDATDPKTVENLLEMKSCEPPHGNLCIDKNHFETAFGAGVKLRSVTIEMTKEDVTWGVEKLLPWLGAYDSRMFDGQRYNTINSQLPFANSLSAGAFSTEVSSHE